MIAGRLAKTVEAMFAAAEGGDVAAGKFLIGCTIAPAREDPVDLPLEGTLVEQAQQILNAVGNGVITPTQSQALMTTLLGMVRIIESSEMEARIAALEYPTTSQEDISAYVPNPAP